MHSTIAEARILGTRSNGRAARFELMITEEHARSEGRTGGGAKLIGSVFSERHFLHAESVLLKTFKG